MVRAYKDIDQTRAGMGDGGASRHDAQGQRYRQRRQFVGDRDNEQCSLSVRTIPAGYYGESGNDEDCSRIAKTRNPSESKRLT